VHGLRQSFRIAPRWRAFIAKGRSSESSKCIGPVHPAAMRPGEAVWRFFIQSMLIS
jgi:hypothetical protein